MRCAFFAMLSHMRPLTLWSQMIWRTRGMENFRAAAGAGIHARFFHFPQRFIDGKFGDAREIVDFDHGEGFEVHVRMALLQAADQFQEKIERKIGMQAADDVKFGGAFAHALSRVRTFLRA